MLFGYGLGEQYKSLYNVFYSWILCICTATENYKTAAEQPVFSGSQIPHISEFGNFVITLNYQK